MLEANALELAVIATRIPMSSFWVGVKILCDGSGIASEGISGDWISVFVIMMNVYMRQVTGY